MQLCRGFHFEWEGFGRFIAKDILYGTLLGSHMETLRDSVSLVGYIIMKLPWSRDFGTLGTSSFSFVL